MAKRKQYTPEELVALCRESDRDCMKRIDESFLRAYQEPNAMKRRDEMIGKLMQVLDWPKDDIGIEIMASALMTYVGLIMSNHPYRIKPCMMECTVQYVGVIINNMIEDHCKEPEHNANAPSQN